MQKVHLIAWILALGTVTGATPVCAQTYPTKTIRIVTALSGGTIDLSARIVAQGLSGPLGQQVIVDNRGLAAAEIVAKAPADGHTLIVYASPLWLAPFLREHVSWDPLKDFAPITLTDQAPSMLVVHPSFPVKSIQDLISLAQARPGDINYGRASSGSSPHLAGELFNTMAKVNIVSVPYKSGTQALTALMSGEVQAMFSPAGTILPLIKSGRLRALAVTGNERFSLYPDLPTVSASGLPGYEAMAIVGMLAPAGTPVAIINRLNHEVVQAFKRPEVEQRFAGAGVESVGSTAEEFAAAINGGNSSRTRASAMGKRCRCPAILLEAAPIAIPGQG